jgi:cytoskeletal protein RodZ
MGLGALGQILRETREQRGLTLEEVEAAIKVRKPYLMALEEEDFASLPHPTYVKGFIRSYASFLELDPQYLLSLYPEKDRAVVMQPAVRVRKAGRGAGFWAALAFLVLLVLGVAAYGYYYYYTGNYYVHLALPSSQNASALESKGQPSTGLPTATPLATPSPPALAAPAPVPTSSPTSQTVEVRVKVLERSWVRVIVDSSPVFTGFLEPGEDRTWVGEKSVFMTAGNAGGLRVVQNGRDWGLLGEQGEVVNVEWTRSAMNRLSKPPIPPSSQ